jgi:hypothetical protein
MKTCIALVALSFALALGGGSAVMAKAKSHNAAASLPQDPREAYLTKRKGGFQNVCDLNASCNGWGAYFEGIKAGKKFRPVGGNLNIGKI